MKYTEQDIFEEALEHLELLVQHRERGSFDDLIVVDAVCMRLLAAMDTLARLSNDRRDSLFANEWHAMRGRRNRLAHGYVDIDITVVASTVDENIPPLIQTLKHQLGSE